VPVLGTAKCLGDRRDLHGPRLAGPSAGLRLGLLFLVSAFTLTAGPSAAQTNPHGNPDLDCAACHDEALSGVPGQPVDFQHDKTKFPLTGRHAQVPCRSCHRDLVFAQVGTNCVDCHADMHRGRLGPDCAKCHETAHWTDRERMRQMHAATEMPLVGNHAQVDCDACHRGPVSADYVGTPTDCYSCHQANYDQTTNPPHASSGMGTDCRECHDVFGSGWGTGDFQHPTSFPLTGAHVTVNCASCHTNGYPGTPTECVACHQSDYDQTANPPHASSGIPTDCTTCHATNAWEPATFNHAATPFPLTGAHVTVNCASCHTNGYPGTPTECVACHQTDYNQTMDPPHGSSGIPTDCTSCHSTAAWQPSTFSHNATGFPLTGAHVTVNCASCHTNGYPGTPTECVACHQTNYNQTTNPPHASSGIPNDCVSCHSTTAWQPASFNHNATSFPLTGAHVTVNCASCHTNGYPGTPTECVACHQTDYNQTTDPPHASSGIPTDCTSCHSTTAWQPASFNHNATSFPLTGAHVTVNCASCHTNGYPGTPTECVACHQTDYNQTTDPPHGPSGIPTDCTSCHSTTAWQPSTFSHNATGFPLTGAHVTVNCASCHTNGYPGTPTECVACHQTDYNQTTDPPHGSSGIPNDCVSCHSTTAWQPASFNHNATGFPLTGAHVTVNCASCHTNGYPGTPTDCVACHQTDYNQTTDPPHGPSGIPTDCTSCHSTTAWQPASFNHNATSFPLTGAHVTVNCASCHTNGYPGTPTDCVACHQTDYNQTTDPPHASAGFPNDCVACHSTTAWTPSTWDHDPFFPIYSGRHRDAWNTCAECHNVPSDYQVFECILCHEHNRTDTDSKHDGQSNYQYLSTACYECHPRGNAK
jgi:hypothetical protein